MIQNENMITDTFDPPVRVSKTIDWVEGQMYEWAEEVLEEYGWNSEYLSEKQCDAIESWIDEQGELAGVTMIGFRGIINWNRDRLWEEKHDND